MLEEAFAALEAVDLDILVRAVDAGPLLLRHRQRREAIDGGRESVQVTRVGRRHHDVRRRHGPGVGRIDARPDEGELLLIGKVGSGLDFATLDLLGAELAGLEIDRPAFDPATIPGPDRRRAHWLDPVLVAEVTFSGTPAGYELPPPGLDEHGEEIRAWLTKD